MDVESRESPGSGADGPRWFAGYQGNRPLTLYVIVVALLGTAMMLVQARESSPISVAFLLWFLFHVGAELLWLETPTGEATDSMASTFNVAALYVFGNSLSIWIMGLSVLVATRFIQKKDWTHSIFGLGQIVITGFVAGTIFELLAGKTASADHFHSVRGVGGLLAACVSYYGVNTSLVAGAIALERKASFVQTIRTNYLYRNAITSSAALFALSPILLLSYISLGYAGVILFFLPLVIVKNQNREYIELQRTTQALISSERMAAKGEMAAAVAHEMNNYLAVLSGRSQLLQRKVEKRGLADLGKDVDILWAQVERLTRLARGLLDFSHKELKVVRFDLNALCTETVEFLSPQNAFDGIRLDLELDPELGAVEADAGQIHQVLLNLCRNAADAIRDAGVNPGAIRVRTRVEGKDMVRLEVEDNGPGVPLRLRPRIFEPGFTTKVEGHGFGLATTFRIVENHKGRIWVEDAPTGGARFVCVWPRGVAKAESALAA